MTFQMLFFTVTLHRRVKPVEECMSEQRAARLREKHFDRVIRHRGY